MTVLVRIQWALTRRLLVVRVHGVPGKSFIVQGREHRIVIHQAGPCRVDQHKKAGTTLVLVTHDPEVASRADRKIVLKDGMVVEDTLPFAGPEVGQRDSPRSGESNG